QHEQSVLLDAPVAQENFALSIKRVRIASFAGGLETSFQFALYDSFGAAGIFNDLIRKDVAKVYAGREWRIFRLRLHGKITVDLAVCDTRGNLGKLQHVGLISERRTQLVQKKPVSQRYFGHLCVSVEGLRAANVGAKIYTCKTRDQLSVLFVKREIAVLDADYTNFRSNGQSWLSSRRLILNGDLR